MQKIQALTIYNIWINILLTFFCLYLINNNNIHVSSTTVTIPENQQKQPLSADIKALKPILTSNGFIIRFNPEETNSGAILKKIGDAGFKIVDVSTYQPDLEDIFLDLTR